MGPLVNKHAQIYWTCLKISFVFVWALVIIGMVLGASALCPYPTGICKLYTFSPLFTLPGKVVLLAALAFASFFYLREKYMITSTLVLALLSAIIITYEESNGLYQRATLLSMIWLAQSFAYIAYRYNKNFNLNLFRQQYVVQIICAGYMLAGISKLMQSGFEWPAQSAQLLPIHMMKGFAGDYYSFGNIAYLNKGMAVVGMLSEHYTAFKILLGMSMILELTCFMAIVKPGLRFVYGAALLLMHLGILYTMNILISPFAFPMVIFFMNPLFYIVIGFAKAKQLITKPLV